MKSIGEVKDIPFCTRLIPKEDIFTLYIHRCEQLKTVPLSKATVNEVVNIATGRDAS